MFCSTSVSLHLLRGVAALALIFGVFFFNVDSALGMFIAALAVIAAIVLLRGCPMCWLLGLFEAIRHGRDKTPPGS